MSDEVTSRLEREIEWHNELDRKRADEAKAHAAVLERERPKLYFAALLAWLGVAVGFAGAVLTASDNRGHQVVWVGLWIVVQGAATFVVWLLRTDRDARRY